MENFDAYVFITPVYFHEMSESAKTFFDRLKRCDAFNDDSKIKGKKIVCIACAGGSGSGTVTDLFGNEQRYDESINGAVVSNGKVHNEVTETVKKYLKDGK